MGLFDSFPYTHLSDSFFTSNDLVTIYTIHSEFWKHDARFIPEKVAEASQVLRRDANVLPKLFNYE
jgi:hypothetical protein